MKIIDMNSYPRKAHFDYFRGMAYPYFGVTSDVNVTGLVRICREKSSPFILPSCTPVSILAHHALADGLHIARFYSGLDRQISRLVAEIEDTL